VTFGDLPSCFIDGRRSASGVGNPPRMNGNAILLVLQVGATVTDCGAIAEILLSGHYGRTRPSSRGSARTCPSRIDCKPVSQR
jgi:hypothetical protein